jgi:O-antigen/teichoic acid export membrane protein
MFKKILNTIVTKVLAAVISLVTIVAINRYLKTDGLGFISIFTNIIFIINLFNGFIGGSAIVYLLPQNMNRRSVNRILIINYIGIIFLTFIVLSIFRVTRSVDDKYIPQLYILTVLFSFTICNALVLLALEKISAYNGTLLLQGFLNLACFLLIKSMFRHINVDDFITSMFLSYFTVFLISLMFILREIRKIPDVDRSVSTVGLIQKLLFWGFLSQTATTIQFLNYRISLFFINKYLSLESVGVYNVAIKISEAIWMVSSSIALVQYSKIANQKNDYDSINLTVKLSSISIIITGLLAASFLIMPISLIHLVFGNGLDAVKQIILLMSVGIISMGYSTIFAHYFAGKGKYQYNILTSFVGLFVSVLGNLFYVKLFGLTAAAVTSSVVYLLISIVLVVLFKSKSGLTLGRMIDFSGVYNLFRKRVYFNQGTQP